MHPNGRTSTLHQATGIAPGGIFVHNTTSLKNEYMKQEKQSDVIIVGGSYSGLAAGMALGRALRKVLIIDAGNPCNKQTPHSHNFLTNDGKTPKEISSLAKKQVRTYGSVSLLDAVVTAANNAQNVFKI